ISEDEISDHASPRLASIRRQIRLSGDRIRVELNKMISGSAKDYLRDSLITMRNGRFCIPVKAGNQSQVSGIVHDTSSTGNTVFIEPASVVKLNNEIRELEGAEQEEIEVILADLSNMAAEYTGIISSDIAVMTELDFIFARASLAMHQNATRPLFNDKGIIQLKKARHPLLNQKKVVPIDISLGQDFDMLIITGPNTGGKTVSLKTLGLLLLMGLSGLHIPCADRSRLGFYREIYADIGDEQSIEQSLSTFSGHMANIVSFWEKADPDCLVLFDELGAGTDPVEGAALASAILKGLLERGVRTAATTHYSELKVFAMRTDRVVNGSCEFDVETLSPTYRLMIGLPGKSNAFAISQKLGLPADVIDRAKEEISDTQESFEDLLTELETSRLQIERDRNAIAKERKEIEELRHEIKEQKKALSQRREKVMAQATEEASRVLQKAKDYADQTIRYYNKHGGKDSARELEERRANLRTKIDSLDKRTAVSEQPKKKKGRLKPTDLKLGDDVKVLSLGLNGTVNSLPDAKGMLFVTMGIMRSKVSIDDLEKIDTPDITGPGGFKKSSGSVRVSKAMSISQEINLLGKTVDEAISELDKYLDDASLAHLNTVRIVHGKGTGALRKAVHDFLRSQKRIKSYRLGEFGEGDSGVTIAEFR
ncbi:MAG: endonuclease MutS2, partial [Lachnospiraceae bacterium]|nr:endonuclease MutS2 [Candidatus Equihabitans merdae]